jgi:hypothetical protein
MCVQKVGIDIDKVVRMDNGVGGWVGGWVGEMKVVGGVGGHGVRCFFCEDRCIEPRNLFWSFHALHPDNVPQREDTQILIEKKY